MPTSRRSIDATPDDVFGALIDAVSYPRWLVGAKHILRVDPEWPAPGSGFRHEVGAGPVETQDRTTVSAIEPNRALDLIVRARPFLEADVHFEVSGDGNGATITMRETPRGRFKLLSGVAAPLIKWRNDRSLERLEALLVEHP